MVPNKPSSQQDPRTAVAMYESFLDLFTLLSFVLIIAAIIRVERLVGYDQNTALVSAQNVTPALTVARAFPRDELVMVVYKTNSVDCLSIIDGPSQTVTNLVVTQSGINGTMKGLSQEFARVSKIKIGVYNLDQGANAKVALSIAEWLNNNNFKRYYLFFSGTNE